MDELEPPPSTFRCRNSISTSVVIPNKFGRGPSHLQSPYRHQYTCTPRFPARFSQLLPLLLSYASLKDLLCKYAAINSPTNIAPSFSLYEISIRNRHVKHAAWAYLQPKSYTRDFSAPHCLRRLGLRFSKARNLIADLFDFISCQVIPGIARAFDCIFRLINKSHLIVT